MGHFQSWLCPKGNQKHCGLTSLSCHDIAYGAVVRKISSTSPAFHLQKHQLLSTLYRTCYFLLTYHLFSSDSFIVFKSSLKLLLPSHVPFNRYFSFINLSFCLQHRLILLPTLIVPKPILTSHSRRNPNRSWQVA